MLLVIVGATGVVGREMIKLINSKYKGRFSDIHLFASKQSAGKKMTVDEREIVIKELNEENLLVCNKDVKHKFALMAVSSSLSLEYSPILEKNGFWVIDNSSAYREKEDNALIVPEINFDKIDHAMSTIIANPNCSTIIMCMALNPLIEFGIDSVVVSTYQAASGAGIAAMEELEGQAKDYASGKELKKNVFGRQYLFNCFPHNSTINDDGSNGEERKMINETKKILGLTKVFPTCVRIPVLRCHSESIHVRFKSDVNVKDIEEKLKKAPSIVRVPDADIDTLLGTEKEEVLVSRVRQLTPDTVELFVVGDQILKGAALNAVQIMKKLLP